MGRTVSGRKRGEAERALRARHDGWTEARRRRFLEVLALAGNVRDACRVVGLSSTSAYRMRRRSAGFARDWDAALARAAVGLEAVAYARAVEGVEEPVYQGGKLVGTRRRYANDMLRLLLQASDPAKFGRMGARLPPELIGPDGRPAKLADIEARLSSKLRAAWDAEAAARAAGAKERLAAKLDEMAARARAGAKPDEFCPTCGEWRGERWREWRAGSASG